MCTSLKFFRTAILEPLQSHFAKIAHKVAKSKYFEKFKLNRNLQRIPFKMMYNMSMLRHRFSNKRWEEGALSYLLLLGPLSTRRNFPRGKIFSFVF